MPTAMGILTQIQARMNRANLPHWTVDDMHRLSFFEVEGLYHVEYYGPTPDYYDWAEEEVDAQSSPTFFEALAMPEVANRIASLIFDGPDEGANGTRDWDFHRLLEQNMTFPELETLIIRPSPIQAHNCTVLGYEADGQLAAWLSKSPRLSRLTTPSAPNAEFFQIEHQRLYSMRVSAGYDPADFILNLSRQPGVFVADLDWDEVHNFDRDFWEEGATPVEHFEALFSSPACPGWVILRNPRLTNEQIEALAKLHKQTVGQERAYLRVFYSSYGFRG